MAGGGGAGWTGPAIHHLGPGSAPRPQTGSPRHGPLRTAEAPLQGDALASSPFPIPPLYKCLEFLIFHKHNFDFKSGAMHGNTHIVHSLSPYYHFPPVFFFFLLYYFPAFFQLLKHGKARCHPRFCVCCALCSKCASLSPVQGGLLFLQDAA